MVELWDSWVRVPLPTEELTKFALVVSGHKSVLEED